MSGKDRREFLQKAGLAGMFSAIAPASLCPELGRLHRGSGEHVHARDQAEHSIKFAAIGLDHAHIFGMIAAIQRGGGTLVAFHATDPAQIADFNKHYPDVKLASEDEILNDKSIQLVAGAPIPDLRAPLGIRVMKAGKDYLADKPGITTLKQLADVRKAVKETGRKFAIMYSERLEVRSAVYAGELIKQGAIGRVVQTVNLAPHRVNAPRRPAWFFDKARYGGILCDIGSHQADQFLYYTNSTKAKVVAAQTGNVAYPQYPKFEDFGDMVMSGNGGTGYVRVDWYTPDGLPTWGDGRLFVLGTEGYIELRKYINVASGLEGGNHLYIVDKKQARYIDCKNVQLPFGPQFVTDIVNRTQNRSGPGAGFVSRGARAQGTDDRDAANFCLKNTSRGIMSFKRAPLLAALFLCASALADESAGPAYVPYQPSGIYALGETAGWNVTLPWNSPTVSYVIRKNNLAELGRGTHHAGHIPRKSKRNSTSPAWCMSRSPRTHPARSRARSARRWRRKRSRRRFPCPRTSTRSGRRRSRRCARFPRNPNSRRSPARRTASISPSSR